jgi:F0F1-type ATP synthase membrane subunit c/vacuolar-type H+-ATPase subunit K
MFGAYIRATITVGIAVLSAAILQFIVPRMLPYLGSQDSYLYNAFSGIASNALLIMLAAIGAGLIARAVTESNTGVR